MWILLSLVKRSTCVELRAKIIFNSHKCAFGLRLHENKIGKKYVEYQGTEIRKILDQLVLRT